MCLNMYNYDINVFLSHIGTPKVIEMGEKNFIYSKKTFRFKEGGNIQPFIIRMDEGNFSKYYEKRLENILRDKCFVKDSDKLSIAFFGGIDSSSLVLALNSLNIWDMVVITITGVPDAETHTSMQHARRLTSQLGIDHLVSNPRDIQDIFHLKMPFLKVLNDMLKRNKLKSDFYWASRNKGV